MTLQQLDPIYVDFYLPQQSLAQIKVGQQVTAKVDTYPGITFNGEISAINSLVDTATRNVQVRATLKNPDDKLLPGMFATVDIDVGAPQSYVTLPQTAIAYNSYGNIVYLVDDKGKRRERQAAACRAADLRHHRRDPRRSGRDPQRRQGRRHGGDRRPGQAAQRHAAS